MQDDRFFGDNFDDYVQVAERVAAFYADHPQGRILTSIVEHRAEDGFVLMKAEIYRNIDDVNPSASGHAFEYRDQGEVNRTSYVENCETSVVGRALAMLGYEVKRGIASREEMEKVARHAGAADRTAPPVNHRPAYEWTETKKGKPVLMLKPDQAEPDRVECPLHPGVMLTRRSNEHGAWLSHRNGDGYCSADIRWQPRPQVQAANLRETLAAHNGRNGANEGK